MYLTVVLVIYHGRYSIKTRLHNPSLDENLEAGVRMCTAAMMLMACVVVGAIVVHFLEGLGFVESLLLSVGFGDLSFKTNSGSVFVFVWMLFTVQCLSRTVRNVMDYSYFVVGDLFG